MAYYSQPDGYGKGQGESSLSLIETLFDALSANKGLSKNNKRLDSDLGALSALVSSSSSVMGQPSLTSCNDGDPSLWQQ